MQVNFTAKLYGKLKWEWCSPYNMTEWCTRSLERLVVELALLNEENLSSNILDVFENQLGSDLP